MTVACATSLHSCILILEKGQWRGTSQKMGSLFVWKVSSSGVKNNLKIQQYLKIRIEIIWGLMEHQFGPLHRGGTSVDLCPSLEVMVMVILQGILVQEVHWAKSSTVQSPEEKINLSWTPISLGALLPHPVRPMPQCWKDMEHSKEIAGDPQVGAACHSPQSGWPRHTQHGASPSQPSTPPARCP